MEPTEQRRDETPTGAIPAPLGWIEPHAGLLIVPSDAQLLYKVTSVENLLRSIAESYLYFNRVDSYPDFPGADHADGQQLARDLAGNRAARFAKAPDFSAADYYDQSRKRTYACCFAMADSEFIWREYGNGGARGKVGLVFDFAKLRATLNRTFESGGARVMYRGQVCRQIFSINYGMVQYIDRDGHHENLEHLPNPIRYTFLKDKRYAEEQELRVALSALGIGHYALDDGSRMEFPPGLGVEFRFGPAMHDKTIREITPGPGCDRDFLVAELARLGIEPVDDDHAR